MNESDSLICLLLPSVEFLLGASFEVSLPFLESVMSQKNQLENKSDVVAFK
jgi:hypothetical protein